jgi:hypothetical protein
MKKKTILKIGAGILSIIILASFAYYLTAPKKLGFSVVTDYQKTLRVSMTASQDFVPVTSLTLKDGTILSMDNLGDKVFLTIEPGKDKEEIVMCTGINSSTLNFTGCTRGLAFSGTSTAAVAGLAKTHTAGSNVTISNVHYVYDQFVSRFGNELIFGDQSTTTDKTIIFDDGTATSTAIKWDYATNQLLFRRSGDTSYRVMPTQLRGTYANYAALPSTGNSEGDIAITTDDSKLYVWDDSGSTWVLAGGSSGAGTMYKTELLGSESDGGDLKTFSLTSGSWPDEKFLLVYKNGQMQRIGASYDYTEVDSDTIEFTYTLASDDLVTMIVVSVDLYNPAWTSVTEDLIPDADNTHSIGSILKTWKNFFTKTASSWNWATTTAAAGYVPIASTSGKLDASWLNKNFGGDGSDGDLIVTSTTSTLDCGANYIIEKQYDNVTIGGTGVLTVTTTNARGCIAIIKVKGNLTITSTASKAINFDGAGGKGTANPGNNGVGIITYPTGAPSYVAGVGVLNATSSLTNVLHLYTGAAGSGQRANGTASVGSNGAGSLYLEVGGNVLISSTISLNGIAGTALSGSNNNCVGGAGGGGGSWANGTAGANNNALYSDWGNGGGGGGVFVLLYNGTLTNNATITTNGGAGGSAGCAGGAGGAGYSLIQKNKYHY